MPKCSICNKQMKEWKSPLPGHELYPWWICPNKHIELVDTKYPHTEKAGS